ncbi:MAG: ketopantoate reductase family protein [Aquincola tertiaricarbonis]|uniref:ketopantoate reductase family protein n=1 Tax=Aquincola TaxID=391952 RepID=UPI000614E113|nr:MULTISPECIES: 2-dehydropantoate 2-reductase [Aquincola]MCR5866351.1 2-dehydropantoate 2-reductase [Aquincola sp. J276]
MNIAVMGAGAVGCYYGALLAAAGHAVTMVGRVQHVEAMQRDGLRLSAADGTEFVVPVQASTETAAVQGAELVLVCVKSTDTDAAAAAMAPYLSPDAVLLSLQNGVDNAERLQAALGRPVLPAVVYVATSMAGPGHVKHHGRGELVVGPSADSERVAGVLRAAGIPVEVSDHALAALWTKLILNCAYNALSALTELPYGRLAQVTGMLPAMREVVDECLKVAHAAGVTTLEDEVVWQAVLRIAQTMPAQRSSTAQDLSRAKPTEIDHLNGFVVRTGDRLGVPAPANRLLWVAVKGREAALAPPA